MSHSYKLTYFPSKSLAEPIRFLLNYGGIEYEDERFLRGDWPKIKEHMPFGQVPILTVDGKDYHQSLAMARYLAKQVKLVGFDALENLEIDAMVETINELRVKIARWNYEPNEAIKEDLKGPLFSETIPYYMQRLDNIAEENNGYLACNRLTWADMFFVGIIDYMNQMTKTDLIEEYTNLEKVKYNVLSLPALRNWLEIRPVTRT